MSLDGMSGPFERKAYFSTIISVASECCCATRFGAGRPTNQNRYYKFSEGQWSEINFINEWRFFLYFR